MKNVRLAELSQPTTVSVVTSEERSRTDICRTSTSPDSGTVQRPYLRVRTVEASENFCAVMHFLSSNKPSECR